MFSIPPRLRAYLPRSLLQQQGSIDEETPLLSKTPSDVELAFASTNDAVVDDEEPPPSTNLWSDYNRLLDKHPLIVKSTTALFLLGGGDLCGQGLEHLRGSAHGGVDWPRVARFAAFGFFGAPWSHYYFYYLDYYLPPTEKPFTKTTLLKVLIDQFIQAPILLALMIATLSLLKGDGLTGVHDDLQAHYVDSLIANWKLWLPFSFLNLAFCKPSLRVLCLNIVFFLWTIILSMMLNASHLQ